jgi:membrane-associated HD superfamily phosphohydrolase
MDLEQFSECDITLADLTKIRHALVNTLSGVYHHRIKYPNLKYKRTESGKTTGENE